MVRRIAGSYALRRSGLSIVNPGDVSRGITIELHPRVRFGGTHHVLVSG